MSAILLSLIRKDAKISRRIRKNQLEGEDLEKQLEKQRVVLSRANQIADQLLLEKNLGQ